MAKIASMQAAVAAALSVAACLHPAAPAPSTDTARLIAFINEDAGKRYGAECGAIAIPPDAFIPLEITGGGAPEIAVSFARVRCGESLSRWTGTGGVVVEFWTLDAGDPRMLLEQQMHGFTPARDRLITMQHGGFCPDGAGPDQCRVTYQWNNRQKRLDVIERQLASQSGKVDPMAFDWNKLR